MNHYIKINYHGIYIIPPNLAIIVYFYMLIYKVINVHEYCYIYVYTIPFTYCRV